MPSSRSMYADNAVLKLLFEQHYHQLVRFAHTYLADADEAEDIVQGVFISLWEKSHRNQIQIKVSIQNYLYKSVKNRCLDKLKSLHIRDKHNLLYTEYLLLFEKESNHAEIDLNGRVKLAIDKLPNRMRRIFDMKYLQGKKTAEISELMHVSKNTIKTQLQRGKSKLRVVLDPNHSWVK